MQRSHKSYLKQCCELARTRLGLTGVNPPVGCVIVKNGMVIAEGVHQQAGYPHAEVIALELAGRAARGATVYVSLEPCCHHGRTPPCAAALVKANVAEVYYAQADKDARVQGGGAQYLREHGIPCAQIELAESDELYHYYNYWQQHQLPWVTVKLALSNDYKFAGKGGSPLAITGPAANRYTQQQRLEHSAILSTATTVNNDNSRFNVRLGNATIAKDVYILDTNLQLTADDRIWDTAASLTLFCAVDCAANRVAAFESRGAKCIKLPRTEDGLDLHSVLKCLGERGVHSLWVEVGPRCAASFYEAELVQRLIFYVSPHNQGGAALASGFTPKQVASEDLKRKISLGLDTMYEFEFVKD